MFLRGGDFGDSGELLLLLLDPILGAGDAGESTSNLSPNNIIST